MALFLIILILVPPERVNMKNIIIVIFLILSKHSSSIPLFTNSFRVRLPLLLLTPLISRLNKHNEDF